MLTVTLGCQLEILMIVEALILKGFEIVSLNTDGWDSIVPKSRLEEYFKIVSHYEKIIGNQELGNVEYTRFEWIAQTSVNHYVAKKIGEYSNGKYYEKTPELKSKGMFAYWVELWKNSSFAIFALAWQKYFDEGVDPEELIMNHDDIFDFCARSNSGKSFYHESYDEKGKATKESKLIRYYVGKKGKNIKKVVREGNLTGAKDTNLRPADSLKVICNRLPKSSYKEHLDNVDRQWYITEVKNVIYAIENGKRPKKNNISKDQLSMF